MAVCFGVDDTKSKLRKKDILTVSNVTHCIEYSVLWECSCFVKMCWLFEDIVTICYCAFLTSKQSDESVFISCCECNSYSKANAW